MCGGGLRRRHARHGLFTGSGGAGRGRFLDHGGAGSQKHGNRWKRRNENDKFFHDVDGFQRTIRRKCLHQMY